MANKDYYGLLGVGKNATDAELKSAFRRKAKQFHPDTFATKTPAEKKEAEEKFKEINHAYDVLSDSNKRAVYDQYGDENAGGGFGGFDGFSQGFSSNSFDFDDIISSIFGGGFGGSSRSSKSQRQNMPQSGQDILVGLSLTFEEAAFGVEKEVNVRRVENCPACHGSGAKNGTSFKTCPNCGGSGQVKSVQKTPFGQFSSVVPCPTCKGMGKVVEEVCPKCNGNSRREFTRKIKVNIPAGIDNDQRINYAGEGGAGINGGSNGNLIVQIKVLPHKLFKRDGTNLHITVPISMIDATLGTTIEIPTLDGKAKLSIPSGTQTGTEFKIKNKGVKYLKRDHHGDLFVKVFVEVPKTVSRDQKELLKKLQTSVELKQFSKQKEFKEKLK